MVGEIDENDDKTHHYFVEVTDTDVEKAQQ